MTFFSIDPLDSKGSIWQELAYPAGPMPRPLRVSRGLGAAEEEATFIEVCFHSAVLPFRPLRPDLRLTKMIASFMSDKIMPLTQAVEGYEIFDGMRAQKVVFEAQA